MPRRRRYRIISGSLTLTVFVLALNSCSGSQRSQKGALGDASETMVLYLSPEMRDTEQPVLETRLYASRRFDVPIGHIAAQLLRAHFEASFTNVTVSESRENLNPNTLLLIPRMHSMSASRVEAKVGAPIDVTLTLDMDVETMGGSHLATVSSGEISLRDRGDDNLIANPLTRLGVLVIDLALVIPETVVNSGSLHDAAFVQREYNHAYAAALSTAIEPVARSLRTDAVVQDAINRRRIFAADPRDETQRVDALLTALLDGSRGGNIAVADVINEAGQPDPTQSLTNELIRKRLDKRSGFHVIQKDLVDAVLSEIRVKRLDLISPEHLTEFGRLASADSILVGITHPIDSSRVRLDAKLFDLATGKVVARASETLLASSSGTTDSNRNAHATHPADEIVSSNDPALLAAIQKCPMQPEPCMRQHGFTWDKSVWRWRRFDAGSAR